MKNSLSIKLINIIREDDWMLDVLRIVRDLQLPDCWIGAGFVRNKVWDFLHNQKRSLLNDIDVIYFDKNNCFKEKDLHVESQLKKIASSYNWSVKNQARMHLRNKQPPYKNCLHAISFWPETATAIAININFNNEVNIIAPYGLDDLFELLVKPTPNFDINIFNKRIKNKSWVKKWPNLSFSS